MFLERVIASFPSKVYVAYEDRVSTTDSLRKVRDPVSAVGRCSNTLSTHGGIMNL